MGDPLPKVIVDLGSASTVPATEPPAQNEARSPRLPTPVDPPPAAFRPQWTPGGEPNRVDVDVEEPSSEPERAKRPNPYAIAGLLLFFVVTYEVTAFVLVSRAVRAKPATSSVAEERPAVVHAAKTTSAANGASAAPEAPTVVATSATIPAATVVATAPEAPLPKGMGWLTLNGPSGRVFVQGKDHGDSGTKLVVPCGYQWVAIATVDGKGKLDKPLTKPKALFIKCGESTVAEAKPK